MVVSYNYIMTSTIFLLFLSFTLYCSHTFFQSQLHYCYFKQSSSPPFVTMPTYCQNIRLHFFESASHALILVNFVKHCILMACMHHCQCIICRTHKCIYSNIIALHIYHLFACSYITSGEKIICIFLL